MQERTTSRPKWVELPPNFLERVDLRLMYPDKWGNPVMVKCPVHEDSGKPNLAVYPHNVYCFRPGCGYTEGIMGYIKRVMRFETKAEVLEYAVTLVGSEARPLLPTNKREVREPLKVDMAINYLSNLMAAPKQLAWLREKYGLTRDTLYANGVGMTSRFPYAYTIPVLSLNRQMLNIRFRVDPTRMKNTDTKYWGVKGRNSTLLYVPLELLNASPETSVKLCTLIYKKFERSLVFLTEGEFDALAMIQSGLPAVSTTNGARAFERPSSFLVESFRDLRVYVTYDQDEAGNVGAQNVAAALRERGLFTRVVGWDPRDGKDPSELLAKGLDIRQYLKGKGYYIDP